MAVHVNTPGKIHGAGEPRSAQIPRETTRFTARLRRDPSPLSLFLSVSPRSPPYPTIVPISHRADGRGVRQDSRESKDPFSSTLSRLSGTREPGISRSYSFSLFGSFCRNHHPLLSIHSRTRGAIFSAAVCGIGQAQDPLRRCVTVAYTYGKTWIIAGSNDFESTYSIYFHSLYAVIVPQCFPKTDLTRSVNWVLSLTGLLFFPSAKRLGLEGDEK